MLTDAALRNLKPKSKIYKASDRDGMYVTVSPGGTVTFRYDYHLNGRRETLTLGRYGPGGISLAMARELLLDARKAVLKGASPALEKQREKRRGSPSRPSARQWRRGWPTQGWPTALAPCASTSSTGTSCRSSRIAFDRNPGRRPASLVQQGQGSRTCWRRSWPGTGDSGRAVERRRLLDSSSAGRGWSSGGSAPGGWGCPIASQIVCGNIQKLSTSAYDPGMATIDQYLNEHLARGRALYFTREEAQAALGLAPHPLSVALLRQVKKGHLANPRRGFYLILRPEDRSLGAPDPVRWIDPLMKPEIGLPHFLAPRGRFPRFVTSGGDGFSGHRAQATSRVRDRSPARGFLYQSPPHSVRSIARRLVRSRARPALPKWRASN